MDKLADSRPKGLKATGKTQKIFDGGGMHIFLSPVGGKYGGYHTDLTASLRRFH